jgi:hypothetical protein
MNKKVWSNKAAKRYERGCRLRRALLWKDSSGCPVYAGSAEMGGDGWIATLSGLSPSLDDSC